MGQNRATGLYFDVLFRECPRYCIQINFGDFCPPFLKNIFESSTKALSKPTMLYLGSFARGNKNPKWAMFVENIREYVYLEESCAQSRFSADK